MENASKALLIAGGVLILLLILCIGVFLHTQFSNQTKEYKEIISSNEVRKFNSNFEVYLGRSNISVQEIATVINLANEYNGQVIIVVKKKDGLNLDYTTIEGFIQTFFNSTFSCTESEYDNTTVKITKLVFEENDE